jgi:SHS2 domain-containing protein
MILGEMCSTEEVGEHLKEKEDCFFVITAEDRDTLLRNVVEHVLFVFVVILLVMRLRTVQG